MSNLLQQLIDRYGEAGPTEIHVDQAVFVPSKEDIVKQSRPIGGMLAELQDPELAFEKAVAPKHATEEVSYRHHVHNLREEREKFRRYALGGGNLGRVGVTPVEMNAMNHGVTREIHVHAGTGELAAAVEKLVWSILEQLNREGAFKQ
jgi:hypothetical protein